MEEETKYPRATGFLENIEDGACRLTEDEKQDLAEAMVRDLMWQENRGYFEERCDHNPREKAFRDHWLKENEPCPGVNAGWGILQDLFINHDRTKPIYGPRFLEKIQPRDRAIVATVIQWLGTNCGWCFLENTLKKCGYTIVDTAIRDKISSIGVIDLANMMEKAFDARDNWFQRAKELKDAVINHEPEPADKIYCDKVPVTDADKLRTLAHWFDLRDKQNGVTDNDVQMDLRRIADVLEEVEGIREDLRLTKDENLRQEINNQVAGNSAAEIIASELHLLNIQSQIKVQQAITDHLYGDTRVAALVILNELQAQESEILKKRNKK